METQTEQKCIICRRKFKGYGNNAEPIITGRCCDECDNKIVIPFRIRATMALEQYKQDILEEYGLTELKGGNE
jgi:hypothetical protein